MPHIRTYNQMQKKMVGTVTRPRLVISRSHKYIFAQMVDDMTNVTLLGIHELTWKKETETKEKMTPVTRAARLGEFFGKKALEKKITTVIFDRNGYKYHGRIKAFADGVRKAGVQI